MHIHIKALNLGIRNFEKLKMQFNTSVILHMRIRVI